MSDLGNRMKLYETVETQRKLIPLLPVYVRIDGRAFSSFTKSMNRPYDERMIKVMVETTKHLVDETNACIGYTQSDEINLVLHSESHDVPVFFEGCLFKLTSVLAGLASSAFLLNYIKFFGFPAKLPAFDCRVINLPTKTETANMILWRELDATRNAIVSAVRTVASQKAIQNKNASELQEMLFQRGINFNDYPSAFKRGTFVKRVEFESEIKQETWDQIPEAKKPPSRSVKRHRVVALEMPPFSKVINRAGVIFEDATPEEVRCG